MRSFGRVYALQLYKVEMRPHLELNDPQIQQVLADYEGAFTEPKGLPHHRRHDHCILLHEETNSINVRPYRYPYFQKTEIEKIVRDLLTLGMIRPSVSPFSYPVSLVKKQDGSWRMCGLPGIE